ncbi:hypothetical protein Mal15_04400 [Stieleria maiorica]|uniref:Uncharacterized protein n=1 Tax=Stieleria maiorica TaxID=2795974 RepID=A0A5B9M5T4_9BACT|nr:hypothetical protein Mal15_04400 [Stieleria maiorica]
MRESRQWRLRAMNRLSRLCGFPTFGQCDFGIAAHQNPPKSSRATRPAWDQAPILSRRLANQKNPLHVIEQRGLASSKESRKYGDGQFGCGGHESGRTLTRRRLVA